MYIKSEKGASLIEFALLVTLVAVVGITAYLSVGNSVATQFCHAGTLKEKNEVYNRWEWDWDSDKRECEQTTTPVITDTSWD